jgi:hypothetical protein
MIKLSNYKLKLKTLLVCIRKEVNVDIGKYLIQYSNSTSTRLIAREASLYVNLFYLNCSFVLFFVSLPFIHNEIPSAFTVYVLDN